VRASAYEVLLTAHISAGANETGRRPRLAPRVGCRAVTMRAYGTEKAAVAELVRDLDAEQAATVVPACPAWTVRDVVAHLVGICQSQAADTSPAEPETDIVKVLVGWNEPQRTAARDEWTGAMIDARRDLTLAELLEEWDRWEKAAVATINSGAGLTSMRLPAVVADLVLHSQDLRAALHAPAPTTREAGQLGLNSLLFMLDLRIADAELPALRIEDDNGKVLAGRSVDSPILTASRHELTRALGGRRTTAQMATMLAGDGAGRYLPLLSLYDPPAEPLDE
jgi:uncharacterized protein (TIGR03083 family)